MALAPIFKKAYWSLAVIGGVYFVFLVCLLNGWIQRQALYAHKFHTSWWHDPKRPEQFGFLSTWSTETGLPSSHAYEIPENQVRPFNISTPDGEVLFVWHILPVALYTKHESFLSQESVGLAENIEQSLAFKLLATDPESRLIIYFHGNAGTVAQGWRTDTYHAVASGAPDKIHVVTVDYRGFGYSTGNPTERGLIDDGIALLNWALNIAHISPNRIVILGQSLGTAVATAVAERFVSENQVEFSGLILVAAFTDIPTLVLSYSIGGIIPILSPIRPYPFLQSFFAKHVQETWKTNERLANLVRKSDNVDLTLIHSRNDNDIPWQHSQNLFYTAANATSDGGMTLKQMDSMKMHSDLGDAGSISTWAASGKTKDSSKNIGLQIVRYGGHNRIATYAPVVAAVLKSFKL